MCIVLFTTAHPDYALIAIDNRDEYILRPTSRAHWWTHEASGRQVLSARDLQRAEKGTWLGLTKDGFLAVLTNYREMDLEDFKHPVHGVKSRGGMVTAWLGGNPDESVSAGVHHLVKDGGVKGVGGFSMVCGKLRERSEGIAIVSNRAGDVNDVPVMAKERDEVWALSNAAFDALPKTSEEWPKIQQGKKLLKDVLDQNVANKESREHLIKGLFSVLDTDTLPAKDDSTSFIDYIDQLKHSIFIPPIGDAVHKKAMEEAMARGPAKWATDDQPAAELMVNSMADPSPSPALGFDTGLYGTQRQTVILVDWEGNVTFVERALWDGNGNPIPRGEGDVKFEFKVDGWEDKQAAPVANGVMEVNGVTGLVAKVCA